MTVCYKCSQTQAVIAVKLDNFAKQPGRSPQDIRVFEDYLYQKTPLCSTCSMHVTNSENSPPLKAPQVVKHRTGTTKLLLVILLLACVLPCVIFLKPSPHVTALFELLKVVPQTLHKIKERLITVYLGNGVELPAIPLEIPKQLTETMKNTDIDLLVFSIVLVIQMTTLLLRQYSFLSILLFILAFTTHSLQHGYLGSDKNFLMNVSKYCLLVFSVVLVFTKKSTVTISQRIPNQKPEIKVRRSPRKRENKRSPLVPNTAAMFSDDEDSQPQTPMKEVRSKFDILNISGSPTKACRSGTPVKTPISPPRFDLNKANHLRSCTFNNVQEEDSPAKNKVRFDSTSSSIVNDSIDETPQKQHQGTLRLSPVIAVLVISVLLNYYFVVQYVLVT